MIAEESIAALIAQYEKHGWQLRFVLHQVEKTSPQLIQDFAAIRHVPVQDSELDALWFSRPNGEKVSWELRRIGGSPFALVRFMNADDPDELRDSILRAAEAEMINATSEPSGN